MTKLGQTLGPYDPTKPDGGLIVVDLIPEPIREAQKAFLEAAACDIAAKMESGYRALGLPALANQLAVSRVNAGCYSGPEPSLTANIPTPPYAGGQCSGVSYRFGFCVEVDGVTRCSSENGQFEQDWFGPVTVMEFFVGAGNIWQQRIIHGPSQTETVQSIGVSFPSWQNWRVESVSRLDGQPDDCGDVDVGPPVYPDGVELPPPPAPGDVIVQGDIFNVDVNVGGSVTQVSVEVGDVVFDPDVGVNFTVGDLSFTLSPSFTLDFSLPGGGSSDSGVLELLNEIKQNLEQDISGTVTGIDCARNSIAHDYSGQGIRGLRSLSEAVFLTLSDVIFDQCPVDAELDTNLNKRVLASGTAGVNDVVLVPVGDTARAVCLEVNGLPEGLRVYKPAGDEIEAPFGWMCLSEDDGTDTWNGSNIDVKTRKVFYPIGRPRGNARRIRLSLKRGLDWILYVLEWA